MNTKPQIGCYIDGANQPQIKGDVRSVRLSEEFGRVLDRETRNFCLRVEHDVTTERDYELGDEFSGEAADWLNNSEASVPYAWWGWDDGNFGLWPQDIESIKDEIGFVSVKSLADANSLGIETDPEDSSYPPADYEGEWLHVSDHGNCTLYVRKDGRDEEIWSIV